MQVAEKRNFMDIFYINCFSHLLYLSRAREIFHVSRVSWLSFTLYIAEIVYIWWKRLNKKRIVDTHKAERKKVGQIAEVMPRPLNSSILIYSLGALRPEATQFPPTGSNSSPAKAG